MRYYEMVMRNYEMVMGFYENNSLLQIVKGINEKVVHVYA